MDAAPLVSVAAAKRARRARQRAAATSAKEKTPRRIGLIVTALPEGV
jgi:hypothetical protein